MGVSRAENFPLDRGWGRCDHEILAHETLAHSSASKYTVGGVTYREIDNFRFLRASITIRRVPDRRLRQRGEVREGRGPSPTTVDG